MRYTIDLTDSEWTLISYCFPKPSKTGRPRQHPYRELLNAIFYLNKTGCQWRNLPEHFAPWRTVYHYFRLWKSNGLWIAIHTHLREHVRLAAGRKRHASAAIIDSQSVKSTETSDERGYDAGKKVKGRKRHIVVDTLGLLLQVTMLPANVQDRDGANHKPDALFTTHALAPPGYDSAIPPSVVVEPDLRRAYEELIRRHAEKAAHGRFELGLERQATRAEDYATRYMRQVYRKIPADAKELTGYLDTLTDAKLKAEMKEKLKDLLQPEAK